MKRWTVERIMNMNYNDIAHMDQTAAKMFIRDAAPVANKRIARLKENELETPSSKWIDKHVGRFQPAGNQNFDSLRQEVYRLYRFINARTSTVRGFQKKQKEIYSEMGIDDDMPIDTQKAFWDAYHKFEEMDKGGLKVSQYGSDQIAQLIQGFMEGGLDSTETALRAMAEFKKRDEERNEEWNKATFGTADYVPFDSDEDWWDM